ncbi:hypothetical protein ACL02T_15840 [Pseudonocardia sp. RS010]|uniref:hypothetical protein n=1 Tax=Pseudonocardia sp. RS010 TaxID=3385979 RepID=UPI0039A2AEB1
MDLTATAVGPGQHGGGGGDDRRLDTTHERPPIVRPTSLIAACGHRQHEQCGAARRVAFLLPTMLARVDEVFERQLTPDHGELLGWLGSRPGPVTVPSVGQEAAWDLVRAREDVRRARREGELSQSGLDPADRFLA